jgi:FtsH-binding integral membrane protein
MFYTKETQQNSYFSSASYSAGLRSHFISVYNYMSVALAVTGLIAFGASQSAGLMQAMFRSPVLMLIFALMPIGLVFYMSAKMQTMSLTALSGCLMIYSGMIGLSIAPIFLIYTGASIAKTFFISASVFGLTSLYGYTTKKDLTSVGSFAIMGVIGILIASLVNIFLKSSGLDFFISIIGVIVFVVLAAWDTQKVKDIYLSAGSSVRNSEMMSKLAVMSALSLYMDFVQIFMFLLRFFGDRRNDN